MHMIRNQLPDLMLKIRSWLSGRVTWFWVTQCVPWLELLMSTLLRVRVSSRGEHREQSADVCQWPCQIKGERGYKVNEKKSTQGHWVPMIFFFWCSKYSSEILCIAGKIPYCLDLSVTCLRCSSTCSWSLFLLPKVLGTLDWSGFSYKERHNETRLTRRGPGHHICQGRNRSGCSTLLPQFSIVYL